MSASIPDSIASSTIAIVGANGPLVRHFGSGTLLAVADRRFVVTAAHVIRKAHEAQATVGISGGSENYFIATAGNWILSCNDTHEDRFDVAIYPLDPSQTESLGQCTFVRIGDVAFNTDLSRGFFVVSGFPSIWSTETLHARETMKLRLLLYSTYSYRGDSAALQGYDDRYHLLLEAKPEQLVDLTGAAMQFRTRSGHVAQMPQDLRGISGCSVWMIGDLTTSCQSWRADQARLVAVETGVFSGRAVIKATRWSAVTTLLHAAFSELRSTIKFYADQQQ
ncbi:MAG: hypothetical protein NTW45_13070 [Rhodocyclales bacterium]|nr:hypothetical protein [Rhodocyclales bacterium]